MALHNILKKEQQVFMGRLQAVVLSLLFLVGLGVANAQQEPNPAFYQYIQESYNPAFSGANALPSVVVLIRSQWQGVPEAPQSQFAIGSMQVSDRVGLGLNIINDKTFIENQTKVFAAFSYRVPISAEDNLYLGLSAGGNFLTVNAQGLETYNYTPDPLLRDESVFNPNVGVGILLKGEKYYLGLSTPGLLNTKRFKDEEGVVTNATDKPHVYFTVGYNHNFSDYWAFKPAFLMRHVSGIPISLDLTGAVQYKQQIELGLTYKTDNGFAAFALVTVANWLDVGYAYDSSFRSELREAGSSTHEVVLKFKLNNL